MWDSFAAGWICISAGRGYSCDSGNGCAGLFYGGGAAFAQIPYHAVYTSNAYLPGWIVYVYLMLAVVLFGEKTLFAHCGSGRGAIGEYAWCCRCTAGAGQRQCQNDCICPKCGAGESVFFVSGWIVGAGGLRFFNSWINAGSVAANQINTVGQTELTYLILTHYHTDHANGIETLLSRVSVKYLVIPEVHGAEEQALQAEVLAVAKAYSIPTLRLAEETELSLGEAVLTLYPPLGAGGINEEGLSLLCSCQDFDMLVTGDMDSENGGPSASDGKPAGSGGIGCRPPRLQTFQQCRLFGSNRTGGNSDLSGRQFLWASCTGNTAASGRSRC